MAACICCHTFSAAFVPPSGRAPSAQDLSAAAVAGLVAPMLMAEPAHAEYIQ
eukprot:CAMPEP_0183541366 /NCGR_PEP_ID=MMETSP0371-20130417/38302_1 /TAXON_ID=268820 /ORGANISM="Peridinium aciculiferum, Strain PAER-2" /LENGTH=51 /DNA_ID=CAMNT_0025742453 /DNA_START=20 /DNA_END=172 /DNA_ORIENTATION=+